jgi:hypothetical protein
VVLYYWMVRLSTAMHVLCSNSAIQSFFRGPHYRGIAAARIEHIVFYLL